MWMSMACAQCRQGTLVMVRDVLDVADGFLFEHMCTCSVRVC